MVGPYRKSHSTVWTGRSFENTYFRSYLSYRPGLKLERDNSNSVLSCFTYEVLTYVIIKVYPTYVSHSTVGYFSYSTSGISIQILQVRSGHHDVCLLSTSQYYDTTLLNSMPFIEAILRFLMSDSISRHSSTTSLVRNPRCLHCHMCSGCTNSAMRPWKMLCSQPFPNCWEHCRHK